MSLQYCLGIDPGKSGGFALIDLAGNYILGASFTSWQTIHRDLAEYRKHIRLCCIEKVASMPGQGVKSTFTFGMNYGGWLAYLEMARISHELIPPQRWQRTLLGTFPRGESKSRSVDFINRRFPHAQLKKSQHGISDALCIALYACATFCRLQHKTTTNSRN